MTNTQIKTFLREFVNRFVFFQLAEFAEPINLTPEVVKMAGDLKRPWDDFSLLLANVLAIVRIDKKTSVQVISKKEDEYSFDVSGLRVTLKKAGYQSSSVMLAPSVQHNVTVDYTQIDCAVFNTNALIAMHYLTDFACTPEHPIAWELRGVTQMVTDTFEEKSLADKVKEDLVRYLDQRKIRIKPTDLTVVPSRKEIGCYRVMVNVAPLVERIRQARISQQTEVEKAPEELDTAITGLMGGLSN